MKPNRRFGNREDLKGRTKDYVATPCIVADVSGSVSTEELTGAIAECLNICKSLGTPLQMVQVDTQAYAPELVRANTRTLERKACGGTVLAPAIDKLKEHKVPYTSIVVITDGFISESDIDAFKATGKPIIWLITSNGQVLDSMSSGRMSAFHLEA